MSDLTAAAARRIEKPWGYELVWAETGRYVGKILHINAGEALSLQYHRVKDETLHLLRGRLQLEAGDGEGPLRVFELRVGESFHVPPGRRHRLTALEECDVLEASTPELDDIVRLEDRYGRIGGR
jgi:mannose-6-phosphate isomerase